jgi:hypothetical protein
MSAQADPSARGSCPGTARNSFENSIPPSPFLDHDGVPWNNNNAEHAIKAFARLRNSIGGKSSTKGIREYLVLLSISETCRYKGVSFFDFVRSGQADINSFAGGLRRPYV